MFKAWLLPIIFAIIVSSGFGSAFAASDYFLKIDGVDGESTDQRHKGEISIDSFSWGMSNSGSMAGGGGAGAGKVQFQDFHFTKTVDKSSPVLMEKVATGEHIKDVKLTLRKAGSDQQTYLVITLKEVMVSSYSASGSTGDTPIEEISLNFQKIEMEYIAQNPDGTASESHKSKELTGHVTLIK